MMDDGGDDSNKLNPRQRRSIAQRLAEDVFEWEQSSSVAPEPTPPAAEGCAPDSTSWSGEQADDDERSLSAAMAAIAATSGGTTEQLAAGGAGDAGDMVRPAAAAAAMAASVFVGFGGGGDDEKIYCE